MKKDKIFFSELLVYYEPLFTKKQINYLNDYFFNDLSFGEIGQKNNISAMAVCDTIRRCKAALMTYEKKLALRENYINRNELYKKISNKKLCEQLMLIDNSKRGSRCKTNDDGDK